MPEYYINPTNGEGWSYRYFSKEEMSCKCGCGGLPSRKFMDALEKIREYCGFPLIVSSGFRCPSYNEKVASSGRNGPHTIGAADILIRGEKAFYLVQYAMAVGMTGIGIHQRGEYAKRFVHLDNISDEPHPRPRFWSY